MIRIAFFDIDGTLVSLKTARFPEDARRALCRLKEEYGVLLFAATGRSRFEIAQEHLLDGIPFDGFLTNNGQDGYAADGALLYGRPIPHEDACAILRWAEETGNPCWCVSAERSAVTFYNDRMNPVFRDIHTAYPPVSEITADPEKPFYKMVLFLTKEEMRVPMALTKHCLTTCWNPLGQDVYSEDGGKRVAMLTVLERFSVRPEEAIAFGDTENDIGMLRAAGIGVAMGNADEATKAAADYVTADCDEGGIARALERFVFSDPEQPRNHQKQGASYG